MSVAEARFAGPDGIEFVRDVIHHPGAVVVVPLLDGDRDVLMVRQFRAAIGHDLLEVPAGKRDVDGEDPQATAHRELAEEVGMTATSMEKLAEFYNSPGFCDEYAHLFLARGLSECVALDGAHERDGPEERLMTIETVPLHAVAAMVADGRIVDAKSILGLSLAREVIAGERSS